MGHEIVRDGIKDKGEGRGDCWIKEKDQWIRGVSSTENCDQNTSNKV